MQVQSSANLAAGVAVLQRAQAATRQESPPPARGMLTLVRAAMAAADAPARTLGRVLDVKA